MARLTIIRRQMPADIPNSKNYVQEALTDALAGFGLWLRLFRGHMVVQRSSTPGYRTRKQRILLERAAEFFGSVRGIWGHSCSFLECRGTTSNCSSRCAKVPPAVNLCLSHKQLGATRFFPSWVTARWARSIGRRTRLWIAPLRSKQFWLRR